MEAKNTFEKVFGTPETGKQHPSCNYFAKGYCDKCGWIELTLEEAITKHAQSHYKMGSYQAVFIKGANYVIENWLMKERGQLANLIIENTDLKRELEKIKNGKN